MDEIHQILLKYFWDLSFRQLIFLMANLKTLGLFYLFGQKNVAFIYRISSEYVDMTPDFKPAEIHGALIPRVDMYV